MDPVHRVFELRGVGARRGQHDHRLAAELAAELHELVRAEAVVVGIATPDRVGVEFARHGRADAILPFVDRRIRTARPADERRPQALQGGPQVRPDLPVGARVGPHERDEIDQRTAAAGRDDFHHSFPLGGRRSELEPSLLPTRTRGRQRQLGQHAPGGAGHAKAEAQRPRAGIDPGGAVVGDARLEVNAALPEARRSLVRREAHALLALFEFDRDQLDGAALGKRFPVVLEIPAFEALPADLLGVESVHRGMVDFLEELPVEALVNFPFDPIRVDEQHRHAGFGRVAGGRSSGQGKDENEGKGAGGRHGSDRLQLG